MRDLYDDMLDDIEKQERKNPTQFPIQKTEIEDNYDNDIWEPEFEDEEESFDIDDIMDPENTHKNPFAKSYKQQPEKHRRMDPYDELGEFDPGEYNEYNRLHKGKEAHVEIMSPDEYFDRIGQDMNEFKFKQDKKTGEFHNLNRIRKYKYDAIKGDKFAIPLIEYNQGKYQGLQEGRHRAIMAKDLGIEKIPVVITNKDYKRYGNEELWWEKEYIPKKKNPFTYWGYL